MTSTERKFEDLSFLAETAAFEKVTDIYTSEAYSHGFYRYRREHDRLKQIFKYGIVSKLFSEKACIPYISNFFDPENDRNISLAHDLRWAMSFGMISTLQNVESTVPQNDEIFTFLISNSVKSELVQEDNESSRKWRIAPKSFSGLVFLDTPDTPLGLTYGYKIVEWNNSTPEKTATNVLDAMSSAYSRHPELFIPIYGVSGDLYWPRKMKYEEIKRLVVN